MDSSDCSALGLKEQKVVFEAQHYHSLLANRSAGMSSCQSQFQQHCFRKNAGPETLPPPKFLALLRDYELRHARCTNDLKLTEMALAGDVQDGCKYLVWKEMDGMGNQLLSLVCAFLYSLLTNRTMLISRESKIERYLCNPFPYSSWLLPDDFPEQKLRSSALRVHTYLRSTLDIVKSKFAGNNTIPPSNMSSFIADAPKWLHALIVCCDERRDHQFFCPTSQKLFSGTNWFFYLSHEYTLPGLYFIPDFRDKLNDWFPHRDGFMHTSRYLLNPHNYLWKQISDFYQQHLDAVPRQIGIQVRSWRGDYKPSISRQVSRCAVEQKLLPKTLAEAGNSMQGNMQNERPRHVEVSVLVASLRGEYRDELAREYATHTNVGDLSVDVVAASTELWQRTGDAQHDEKAIIDIWLLSFMHDLVTTPFSTFGSTASGMAGIVPLLFNHYGEDKVNEPACARTNAGGPCFIVYPRDQPCDLDPPSCSIGDPDKKVPEVRFCAFNPGLGIVTA
ncbi:hypothetical protein KP509_12G004400 [Ceratopteris richardii]|uniref:Fucosyltransferase n=1 Tax=Ceratopteris richardii TaxID=49495 RepID=A0A8T2TLS2_CERRI|nr:hypothetical protein KP509_12G004400 [Ceratopteris richardii]KAH7422344.1 hypothetical protein KP509_12G004400 [Ceratopteris richardii]